MRVVCTVTAAADLTRGASYTSGRAVFAESINVREECTSPPPAPTNSDETTPYSSLIWCPKPPSMKVSYSIAAIAASHFHSRELKSVSLCNDCGQALSTQIYNLLHSDEWLTWYNPAAATGSSIRLLPPWFEGRLSVPVM